MNSCKNISCILVILNETENKDYVIEKKTALNYYFGVRAF